MKIPFCRYPASFWNNCSPLLTSETQHVAADGDICFLCDGVLFLVTDPSGIANLVVQRIAPSIHTVPVIKHIYKVVQTMHSLGIEYFQFNGAGDRYRVLYLRLFKSLLDNGTPCIIETDPFPGHSNYVLHITDHVLRYIDSQISSIDYEYQDRS